VWGYKVYMKSLIVKAIINLCVKSILLTLAIGSLISLLGFVNHWATSLAYSNAFFLAGCLVIVAGTATKLSAQHDYSETFRFESFRKTFLNEPANATENSSGSLNLVALGLSTGISLALISILIDRLF
jgi:hypothetical protein